MCSCEKGDLALIRDTTTGGHYFGFVIYKTDRTIDLAIPMIDRFEQESLSTYRLSYYSCMKIDLDYIFNCSMNQYVLAWFKKNLKTVEQGLTSNHELIRNWAKKVITEASS